MTEQASAVIEQRTPPKYKDPGCPTITYHIGTHEFGQALLDLGASVNLMPYSIYVQLGLGEIKPTSVALQLADRSIRTPRGVVEDVLVQIDKFYYPVDFLILDTQSVVNVESKIPFILGRPFLATANALINCRNGLMKLSFGNMTLEVNIFHVEKQPRDDDECQGTYMLEAVLPKTASLQHESNPLEVKVIPKNRKIRKRRARVQLKMIPGKLKRGLDQLFNMCSHDFQPPDSGGSVDTLSQLDKHSLPCLHQYARWKPP